MFDLKGYQFQAIVTSLPEDQMDAATAYRDYNARGEFENRIKELKRGCGLEGFCLDSFRATECVLRSLCLLHNLVQLIQDRIGLRPATAPKSEGKRHVLETLRFRFFVCAAALGRSVHRRHLRFSTTDSWWTGFQAALERFSQQVPTAEHNVEGRGISPGARGDSGEDIPGLAAGESGPAGDVEGLAELTRKGIAAAATSRGRRLRGMGRAGPRPRRAGAGGAGLRPRRGRDACRPPPAALSGDPPRRR